MNMGITTMMSTEIVYPGRIVIWRVLTPQYSFLMKFNSNTEAGPELP
ncbi:hypothetical protein Thermo_00285 [Thermoplasmatales archaeon]|nr:hypothetical protein Thermo_00285 [Thermoplasmatales archaeon]